MVGSIIDSSSLKIPDNILLIFQPPYSPELNPIERVWHSITHIPQVRSQNPVFLSGTYPGPCESCISNPHQWGARTLALACYMTTRSVKPLAN
jgi:hypothetical protein